MIQIRDNAIVMADSSAMAFRAPATAVARTAGMPDGAAGFGGRRASAEKVALRSFWSFAAAFSAAAAAAAASPSALPTRPPSAST